MGLLVWIPELSIVPTVFLVFKHSELRIVGLCPGSGKSGSDSYVLKLINSKCILTTSVCIHCPTMETEEKYMLKKKIETMMKNIRSTCQTTKLTSRNHKTWKYQLMFGRSVTRWKQTSPSFDTIPYCKNRYVNMSNVLTRKI